MSALVDKVTVPPLPHRFGLQPDFTLGIEDELLLVEPDGSALRPQAERLIAAATPPCGRLASEIFAAEVELVTPICRSIQDAEAALRDLSASVAAAQATILGAGLHPTAGLDAVALSSATRYHAVSDALKGLLRNPPAGLHVHVGMPDPDTALSVANRMRRHLPMLHSLGANSPFWFGRDSGLASARGDPPQLPPLRRPAVVSGLERLLRPRLRPRRHGWGRSRSGRRTRSSRWSAPWRSPP